jgi:hypothetical protein
MASNNPQIFSFITKMSGLIVIWSDLFTRRQQNVLGDIHCTVVSKSKVT